MSRDLTIKQRKFVTEYVREGCKNATAAALKAGYSKSGARVLASNLLTNINVRSEINKFQAKVDKETVMTVATRKNIITEMIRGNTPTKIIKDMAGDEVKSRKEIFDREDAIDLLNKMEHVYLPEDQGMIGRPDLIFFMIEKSREIRIARETKEKKMIGSGVKNIPD